MLAAVGKETREALISVDCTFTEQHPPFENPHQLCSVFSNDTVKAAITARLPLLPLSWLAELCKRGFSALVVTSGKDALN